MDPTSLVESCVWQVPALHRQDLSMQGPWSHGMLVSALQAGSHLGQGK